MATTNEARSGHPAMATSTPVEKLASPAGPGLEARPSDAAHPEPQAAAEPSPRAPAAPGAARPVPAARRKRKGWLLVTAVIILAGGGYFLAPMVETALNTISTDDAYVRGHATFLAPRVSGQVSRVLVDDN